MQKNLMLPLGLFVYCILTSNLSAQPVQVPNTNPNIIDANGHRQIASNYYPLIGPYASSDPNLIEYHLLLMKLSGIDGVLVDWYGTQGSNGDVGSLLTNSNAMINSTAGVGLN